MYRFSYLQTAIFFFTWIKRNENCHHIRKKTSIVVPVSTSKSRDQIYNKKEKIHPFLYQYLQANQRI